MRKKICYILTGIALAMGTIPVSANTTVATVPDATMTLPIKHGLSNYISLPLTTDATYTSAVTSVTTNTLTVDDTPGPFTASLATPAAPYFVKFLSGNETGRVLLITANTANTITVDTTDHISGAAVALTTTGFSVQAGDTFEVFPGDTLASVFGAGTTANPLVLAGGANSTVSDTVSLYTATNMPINSYYYNTTAGQWEQIGTSGAWGSASTANANNTIIYPYSALVVARRSTNPDTNLVLTGRIADVAPQTKVVGAVQVYTGSHYATDVKLSQLHFGSSWIKGTSITSADLLRVWDSTLNTWDVFYQMPDSTWRQYPNTTTDKSSFTIPAGTVTSIQKLSAVSGGASFVQTNLPYSLQ
jgi:uncharacterized protein (TIGR02597 family)